MNKRKNPAAVALGKLGGAASWTAESKKRISQILSKNGKKGGRPKNILPVSANV